MYVYICKRQKWKEEPEKRGGICIVVVIPRTPHSKTVKLILIKFT